MSEQLVKCRDFMLKEKMISLTDKGEIFNADNNELIGTFRGKLIKIGNTYRIRDLNETPVLTVHEKVISLRSSYPKPGPHRPHSPHRGHNHPPASQNDEQVRHTQRII